ncbi:MAG: hypothetical protein ABI789_11620 [Usitatibacter sp.]
MKLSTYQSSSFPGTFVTLPSAEASATIGIVDKLARLELSIVRLGYELPAFDHSPIAGMVMAEISQTGYAVHGVALP